MGATVKESGPAEVDRKSGLPVGTVLRRARIHYGLEIEDVEAALRIRAVHLSALEDGQADKLPGRVYAIGFVRTYAEYLGLDGAEIVSLFKEQSVESARKPELHFPVSAAESKLPGYLVLGGSLVALVGIFVLFAIFGGGSSVPESISPVPQEQLAADMTAGQGPLESAVLAAMDTAVGTGSPAALLKPESRITIRAVDGAWVEVRNAKGKPILSRIMKAGDSYLVPDEKGLVLSTGNAGVLALSVDGAAIPPLGGNGDILRDVKLDPDALKPAVPLPAPVAEPAPVDVAPAPVSAPAVEEEEAAADEPAPPPRPRAAPAESRRPAPVIVRTPRDREGM